MSPRPDQARCIFRADDENWIEIWDQDGRRSLWFDDVILQSEIAVSDPAQLPNPVNRAMLAPLMFDSPVDSVLLAGCGGGAIARWFHSRAPTIAGDAVELSPLVARLARDYFDFPSPSSNWRLLIDDVRTYLSTTPYRYDYILVDIAEDQRTPAWLTGAPFLVDCHSRLSDRGVLVLNLIAESTAQAARSLAAVRQVFTAGIGLLAEPDHDNLLVLAGRQPLPRCPETTELASRSTRWGINFGALAGRLKRVPPADPTT